MGFDSLRRGAQRVMETRKAGSGGRRGGAYLIWRAPKLPQNSPRSVAEPVVFIDAAYPDQFNLEHPEERYPFFRYRSHSFRRGPKNFIDVVCSVGNNPHNPQPCLGCYEVDRGAKSEARDHVAFNLAHLVPYHQIPYVKDGVVQMKRDNPQEPVLIYNQCEISAINRICKYCQQNAPMVFGQQRILAIGTGHLETILQIGNRVAGTCANCGTHLIVRGFDCEQCNTMLLDLGQQVDPYGRPLTDEFLKQFEKAPQQCSQCNHVALPREILECGLDPQGLYKMPGKGCPENIEPQRQSLFDVVIYLQRVGEQRDTKIVDVASMPLAQFVTPDGQPLSTHLQRIVRAPIDFGEMFKPETLDDQAQRLGIPNPYTQQQQAAPYGSYGAPPQQNYAPPGQQAPPAQGYAQPYQQPYQQPAQNSPGTAPYQNNPNPGRPNFGK